MHLRFRNMCCKKYGSSSFFTILLISLTMTVYVAYHGLLRGNGFSIDSNSNQVNSFNGSILKKLTSIIGGTSDETDEIYSVWPQFTVEQATYACLDGNDKDFNTFDDMISKLRSHSDDNCQQIYRKIKTIYDVKIRTTRVKLPTPLANKLKESLGKNSGLLKQMENQKLIYIYNKYTNEECIYNLIRGNRPQRKSNVNPKDYYENLMKESVVTCDFCRYKNFTSLGEFDRIEKENVVSAKNLFPYGQFHEIFLTRKHDLFQVKYEEFKDFVLAPIEWFKIVQKLNPKHIYPVGLWDFLPKGGASQIHPHIQGTINSDRYYGLFEIIRLGAERYHFENDENYFNDFLQIHRALGLTYSHKDAELVISLTSKKEYDVIILSYNFNDSVIQLLYSVLWIYFETLKIYPFTLSIYYPQLIDKPGKIPLYIKIIPRGDASNLVSDISTLELLSFFNVNMSPYQTIDFFKNELDKRLTKYH